MHYLVNGIVATGTDAFHPGRTPALSEDEEGSDADTGVNGPSNSGSATPSATILDDSVANEVLDEDEATSVSFSSQFHQIIHSIFK